MSKIVKILVIRFSSIGDIVLTTPVVRCIKQQLPNVELHFCTKQAYHTVISSNSYIDKIYLLNSTIRELIGRLRVERYDYIIDLHNNFRTSLIKAVLNTRSFTVNKLNLRKWLYVTFKADVMPRQHLVNRYLATALPLGVRDDGLGLDFFINPDDHVNVNQLPSTHRFGYVAYAIGGRHATKRLPVSRMIELCQKIGKPVILLGDGDDRQVGEQVVDAVGSGLVYNACGHYNLSQSASLLQQSKVVFSHDTGLMHIAAALGKKVYSIWGNTTPQLGMYPYRTPHVVLEKLGLPCRPCSKLGSTKCPAGHFKCMNELRFAFNSGDLEGVNGTAMAQNK
jgi:heptosyltransferase-2